MLHEFWFATLAEFSKRLDAETQKAVGSAVSQSAAAAKAELNSNFDSISKRPQNLIKDNAGEMALAALAASGAKEISFQRMQGFDGIKEFEPAGWQVDIGTPPKPPPPSSSSAGPSIWPAGVGMAMMNGCYLTGYQKGDPCYAFARFSTRCKNLLDGAQFIGVGFDGRGLYSADSRKVTIVQRTCAKKKFFAGKAVPDNMEAYGLYDYSINTQTFQDAKQYVKYLQEKAGAAETESMFQAEASSFFSGQSTGGNLGVLGALAGAAKGGAAGAQMGAALGSSIGLNVGSGRGSSSSSQSASRGGSRETSQNSATGSSNTVNMIAMLEADLKMYEIALGELKPEEMSAGFFSDIMSLPSSYFNLGAESTFQTFISKWGTHFIKSAKFGGQLSIMKTSKKESRISQEEFAETAQSEFSGMLGTLRSSFQQKESGWSFLGLGQKKKTSSQRMSVSQQSNNRAQMSQSTGGGQQSGRSEFIKTTIKVLGGDPVIGAAITDFYTPRFREVFVKWLKSIDNYIRPYDFTLGTISSLLSISSDSLFKDSKPNQGCFGPNVKKDNRTSRYYFERVVNNKDADNNTIRETVRNYCPYGTSRESFVADLAKKKLALERAESIYMTEGPSSTSNFDIAGGTAGCELDSLDYLSGDDKQSITWPKWTTMKTDEFRVIFEMPEDLPSIAKNAEVILKFFNGRWYTKKEDESFSLANSCETQYNQTKMALCISEVPMVYSEKDGLVYLDKDIYDNFKVAVPLWLQQPLAHAEMANKNIQYDRTQINTIGFVPCNTKWSNTHQVGLRGTHPTCLYFKAASAGSIYLIFAGLPQNFKTWFSLRITSGSVSFYRSMKLKKFDASITSGSLGSERLFEPFFICLSRPEAGSLRIQYGKSPKNSEIGVVYSSYTFGKVPPFNTFFYAFGSGENKISVSDMRVVNGQPKIACQNGLIMAEDGSCQLECDEQCQGCHQAKDPKSCLNCKNSIVRLGPTEELCVAQCPEGTTEKDKVCVCPPGLATVNYKCQACAAGTSSDGTTCTPCPENTFSEAQSAKCTACPKGQVAERGSGKCKGNFLVHEVSLDWQLFFFNERIFSNR